MGSRTVEVGTSRLIDRRSCIYELSAAASIDLLVNNRTAEIGYAGIDYYAQVTRISSMSYAASGREVLLT